MSTELYIPPPQPLEFLPCPIGPETWDGDAEKVLEIGPGKGEFLLHLAAEQPRTKFIGLEIKRGRFERIAKKASNRKLENLFMVRGDARECLPRLFTGPTFERIYVLFPDPWPKHKHAKHRLLKPIIIKHLHSILKDKGEIYSATDAGFYSDQILKAFEEAGGFSRAAIESLFPTYFETKWKSMGREIQYWKFTKVSA